MKRVGTIRIGNIAAITSKSLKDVEYYDVVKYYPNEYYGKEDEYVLLADDMYCRKDDVYYRKDDTYCRKDEINIHHRIHKSCFQSKECCYSIAHINDEDDCEIVSVGSRMIELSKQEWLDLKDVLDVFYRKYRELKYETDQDEEDTINVPEPKKNLKYDLYQKEGNLWRIFALRDIKLSTGDVIKKGTFGGLIESEKNLSQEGNCWVFDNAKVYDNAVVGGDAQVYNGANVYGNAQVYSNAKVYENAKVYSSAQLGGYVKVYGDASVYGNTNIDGRAEVFGCAKVYDNAQLYDTVKVYGNAKVYGNVVLTGNVQACGNADLNAPESIESGIFN